MDGGCLGQATLEEVEDLSTCQLWLLPWRLWSPPLNKEQLRNPAPGGPVEGLGRPQELPGTNPWSLWRRLLSCWLYPLGAWTSVSSNHGAMGVSVVGLLAQEGLAMRVQCVSSAFLLLQRHWHLV